MLTGTALVLGGSLWQVDVIQRASQLGLQTIVADISSEAPGRSEADLFIQIDTNDKEVLLRIARENKVDIVIAEQTDRVVPIAAFINEKMGLNGIRLETARKFTDKYAMRNALVHSGVQMPRYSEISTLGQAEQCANNWGYPIVLKPKSSQASLGVFKIDDVQGLQRSFSETMKYSKDSKILVEEFIDGTEITVEGFSLEGKCYVLAISEKEHYPFNKCVARRLTYPPKFPVQVIKKIKDTAEKVVDTLGLWDGISHAEYRVRDGMPYLVEVAARGGGNRIASLIVPHISGVDIYELLIRRLLGQTVTMPNQSHRSANLEFLDFKPGKVKAIHGVEQVKEEGLAQDIMLSFKPGETIRNPTDDRTRLGYFIVLGENREEVDAKSSRVKELVYVDYE
jgi:biotin carboxylase